MRVVCSRVYVSLRRQEQANTFDFEVKNLTTPNVDFFLYFSKSAQLLNTVNPFFQMA